MKKDILFILLVGPPLIFILTVVFLEYWLEFLMMSFLLLIILITITLDYSEYN